MANPKKQPKPASIPAAQPTASRQAPPAPSWISNRSLHIGIIFLFSFLFYANTLGHEYAQDDAIVITDNMFTQQGIKGIPGILGNDTFYGFFKNPAKAKLVAGGRYRPLSLVTFALEWQLFGRNPFIGHLVNVLLFGLCSVLLYLVLLRALPPARAGVQGWFVALAAALIFAAHPIHTEAVANIKGRDEILALLGSLGALFFALDPKGRFSQHLLGGLCLFLGLMSKENAITFLAVIPLTLYFFTKTTFSKGAALMAPYLLAALVFLMIRGSILGWSLGEPSRELMNNPFIKIENSRYVPFTPAEKLATVTFTLGKYVQLLFFPHPLTHDYYPRQVAIKTFGDGATLLSLLLYLGMIAAVIWGWRRKNPLSYAMAFYLLTLSIVSNIVFAIGTNMAERLLFMPSVGFALAVALVLSRLAERGKQAGFSRWYPALGLSALLVLALGVRTLARNPVWKDNFTLFSNDIKVSQNSAKLRNAMGGELVTQSEKIEDPARKQQMCEEALIHLQKAVEIHPNYTNAWLIMGNALYFLNRFDEAIAAYQKALDIDPEYKDAFNNQAIAYRDAGRFFGEQQGDLDKAITYLSKANSMRPDDYETLRLLGVAHGIRQDHQQAIGYFSRAASLQPNLADAWYNLGTAYFASGDAVQGQANYNKAVAIDPGIMERMKK